MPLHFEFLTIIKEDSQQVMLWLKFFDTSVLF